MKNIKLIIGLVLGFSYLSSFAQETATVERATSREAKRKVVVGFKAGVNRSNVYDEQGQEFVANPKSGFAGGAFLALPVGGFIGIQPEILISQKGFGSSGRMFGDQYFLERTTTHVDIPLQLQIKPFRFLSLLAGVQYSYLLKQRDSFTNGTNTIAQEQEFANDNIRRNIFGAVTGLDINLRHVVLSGRAGWDLSANRGDGSSFTPRYKNIWLQATIGYRIY